MLDALSNSAELQYIIEGGEHILKHGWMQSGSYLALNNPSAERVPNMRNESIGHFVFGERHIRLNADNEWTVISQLLTS